VRFDVLEIEGNRIEKIGVTFVGPKQSTTG